jgi:hypothetical protein
MVARERRGATATASVIDSPTGFPELIRAARAHVKMVINDISVPPYAFAPRSEDRRPRKRRSASADWGFTLISSSRCSHRRPFPRRRGSICAEAAGDRFALAGRSMAISSPSYAFTAEQGYQSRRDRTYLNDFRSRCGQSTRTGLASKPGLIGPGVSRRRPLALRCGSKEKAVQTCSISRKFKGRRGSMTSSTARSGFSRWAAQRWAYRKRGRSPLSGVRLLHPPQPVFGNSFVKERRRRRDDVDRDM